MNYKKLVLILFLIICLMGAVNAAKNVDDFSIPSDYYPIKNTFPDAHEGVFLKKDNNSGLVIMKYGEDDEDIDMYLTSSGILFTENDDCTVYFFDEESYSHGIYEVFEVDGEKFFANFWVSNSNDISDDEIYGVVDRFNNDNGVNPISFSIPSFSSSVSGINFVEAADYFPEASTTVLSHVFHEADTNDDCYLSDSELKLFKKVRDHTKNYAVDIKNVYPSINYTNGKTGYCADHGRVTVVDDDECPFCQKLRYSDTATKTSPW